MKAHKRIVVREMHVVLALALACTGTAALAAKPMVELQSAETPRASVPPVERRAGTVQSFDAERGFVRIDDTDYAIRVEALVSYGSDGAPLARAPALAAGQRLRFATRKPVQGAIEEIFSVWLIP